MNKVVIINGTYGVGKTAVANLIASKEKEHFKIMDPDVYYNQLFEKGMALFIGWPMQTSTIYLKDFRSKVEDALKDNNIIIPVTISTEICKSELYDYLRNNRRMVHIILFATDEIIIDRINNDNGRSKIFSQEGLNANKLFLEKHFPDAIWLDTTSKSVEELANAIISLLR